MSSAWRARSRSRAKAVVAIYSTFMQRAIDQAIVNVGLQKAHVIFCLDRAGLVGDDGPTHHGVFDLVYLRMIPGMRVLLLRMTRGCVPACAAPLTSRVRSPSAIRVGPLPVAAAPCETWREDGPLKLEDGNDGALLAVGRMVDVARDVARNAAGHGIDLAVWDMRWVKPIDEDAVREAARTGRIFTLEDGVVTGGLRIGGARAARRDGRCLSGHALWHSGRLRDPGSDGQALRGTWPRRRRHRRRGHRGLLEA